MTKIRLLPVVVMAIAALLMLKTLGLITSGGYVLGGVSVARAAGDAPAPAAEGGELALPGEPTITDTSPTLTDVNPTLASGTAPAADAHGAPAEGGAEHGGEADAADHGATEGAGHAEAAPAATSGTYCVEADATLSEDGTVELENTGAAAGEEAAEAGADDHSAEPVAAPEPQSFAASMADCLPSGDAVPFQFDGQGGAVALINTDGTSLSEQQLLERLAERRTDLEKYEQELTLRASIVDAAEKRIEERTATLQALEAQISALVDQRTEMETGQFAGIVAMYETMKPKDAALIFNNLDMAVLLRVAKTISPRKMAPILAEMDPARAQELTVKMAALADQPATEMTPDDFAALPQIVGQ